MTPSGDTASAPDPALVAGWALLGAPGHETCCVVPTPALARLYRRHGIRGVERTLAGWLATRPVRAPLRLLCALPPAGAALPPRPREPTAHDLRLEALALDCRVEVPYDLAIFAGHFPWAPILPGAMILGWAAGLGARHGLWPHGVVRIGAAKFRHPVQPGGDFRLALRTDAARERLDFRLESSRALHAQGVLLAPPAGSPP